jgi:hypothetical protein
VNPMQYPRFARSMETNAELLRIGLGTVERGAKLYFVTDVQPMVLQACQAHGIGFDLFATRFAMPRGALVLILKGQDPVPRPVLNGIEDFVRRGMDLARGVTAWQSAHATTQDHL